MRKFNFIFYLDTENFRLQNQTLRGTREIQKYFELWIKIRMAEFQHRSSPAKLKWHLKYDFTFATIILTFPCSYLFSDNF